MNRVLLSTLGIYFLFLTASNARGQSAGTEAPQDSSQPVTAPVTEPTPPASPEATAPSAPAVAPSENIPNASASQPTPLLQGPVRASLEFQLLEYDWQRSFLDFTPQGSNRESTVLDSRHHLGSARAPLALHLSNDRIAAHLAISPAAGGFSSQLRGGIFHQGFELGAVLSMATFDWHTTDLPGSPESTLSRREWKLGPYGSHVRKFDDVTLETRATLGLLGSVERSESASSRTTAHDVWGIFFEAVAKASYPILPDHLSAQCGLAFDLAWKRDARTTVGRSRGNTSGFDTRLTATLLGLDYEF